MSVFLGLAAAFGTAVANSATDIATKVSVKTLDARALFALNWATSAAILTGLALVWYPGLATSPAATFSGMIKDDFWRVLVAGGALNAIASYCYIRAFEEADASLAAPLMSLTPVFLLVTSPLMLGETVPPIGALGILLAVIGSYRLGKTDGRTGFLAPFKALGNNRGVRFMLVTVSIWSVTSNLDKMGVLASTPLLWSASISCFVSACACLYWRLGRPRGSSERLDWRFFIPGLGQASQAILQNIALTLILVPYVISIKRTSAILTVLLSAKILKENISERLGGAVLMVAGAILIALASYR
jgi:uncharacterized membrane protein